MTQFTQTKHAVLMAALLAGLAGCGEEKKEAAPPPAPAPTPLTVGGSVSGLNGEVVLQLNGANDLAVKADGKFKFAKPLSKGATYAVSVKTQPNAPVRQTCTLTQANGSIASAPINSVGVTCTTNTFAVGGSVSGLAAKSKGLVIELKGVKEVEVSKNGNFVFPDVRLPDGGDFSVVLKQEPKGQSCKMEAAASAPDSDTINVVTVTCKKGRK